jgi:4-aminobutyrate aminotransferase/(S)-3-amino-2-methylpropionate transaminase
VYRLPYPYLYRRTAPADEATFAAELATFFTDQVAPEHVACVVFEPVAGEGGIIPAPRAFVDALAACCRRHGILLVLDEVQTGFCRTGRMFASEHFGVEPDLVTMAKSLAGGLPLSAVTGRAEVMDSAQPGGLGGTFVGNPVACTAALAAIEFMESNKLAERAAAIGEIVARRFATLAERFPAIGDARGLGAMRGLELVKDRATREPDPDATRRVHKAAYEHGLLLVTAGTYGNVLRTLMPLVIDDDQLDEGLDVLELALGRAALPAA